MVRKATLDALCMASTKNINALYNAKYIDSGLSGGIKEVIATLSNINSEKNKEEKRKISGEK